MKSDKRLHFTKIWFLFLLFTGFVSISGCQYFGRHNHPSDATMISLFQSNKADFTRLIDLLKEDKNISSLAMLDNSQLRFGYKVKPEVELNQERREQYTSLLKKINVKFVEVSRSKEEIDRVEIITSDSKYKYDNDHQTTYSKKGYEWHKCGRCKSAQNENSYICQPCDNSGLTFDDNLDKHNSNGDTIKRRVMEDNWSLYLVTVSYSQSGE